MLAEEGIRGPRAPAPTGESIQQPSRGWPMAPERPPVRPRCLRNVSGTGDWYNAGACRPRPSGRDLSWGSFRNLSVHIHKNRLATRLGTWGVYLYSFAATLSTAAASLATVLMVPAFFPQIGLALRHLRRSPFFWLFVLFSVYVLVRTAAAAQAFPDTAALQWDQGRDFVTLGLIWLVGWWLGGDLKKVFVVIALFVASVVVRIFVYAPWQEIGKLLTGSYGPFGFGIWHIPFGLYASVALAALLIFAPRIIGMGRSRIQVWMLAVGWVLLVLLLLQALFVTKSRGAWLAALAGLPFLGIAYVRAFGRMSRHVARTVATLSVLGVAAALLLVSLNFDRIRERMGSESHVYQAILEGDLDKVPQTSVGTRIHLYYFAAQKIFERPLTGWGPGSHLMLIEQSGVGTDAYQPPHFHSAYVEIPLRLGLIGAACFVAGLWILIRGLWRAYRRGEVPDDLFWFWSAALAITLVWNIPDFRLTRWENMAYTLWLGGIGYTLMARSALRALQGDGPAGST